MSRCRLAAAPLIMLTLLTGACSDDDNSGDADVTSACDRLEVLANDILELQQSLTDEQLATVAEAVDSFVESARSSGGGVRRGRRRE